MLSVASEKCGNYLFASSFIFIYIFIFIFQLLLCQKIEN